MQYKEYFTGDYSFLKILNLINSSKLVEATSGIEVYEI